MWPIRPDSVAAVASSQGSAAGSGSDGNEEPGRLEDNF